MANTNTIEPDISYLIKQNFPVFYREEGPVFIAFMTEYYKWMETANNTLYHSRRIYNYKDIDETTDEFLVYFKEKYLKNIQLTSITNTRQLTKHSLDLYRSKGTERGIDLLFRAVFGVESDVYYPKDDIFRLSDGKWVIPRYLEVSLSDNNVSLINKQITGVKSGAIAFVEQVVRRTVKNRLIDVLYVSAISGTFQTGEKVTDGVLSIHLSPSIIGSLTTIAIEAEGTGEGFVVGDIVTVTSEHGEQAKARVVSISDITGLVGVELLDGGYGYTVNAEVLVSEKVLSLANVTVTDNNQYFALFEKITQPLANIHYENSNGSFANGDLIYTYHANNAEKGFGKVLSAAPGNATAGELLVQVYSGDLDELAFYNAANAIGANQAVSNGFYAHFATANVIGVFPNLSFDVIDITGTFQNNEPLVQYEGANTIVANFSRISSRVGSNGVLFVSNAAVDVQRFKTGLLIHGLTSSATANVKSISLDIGVIDITNSFTILDGNFLAGNTLLSNATITALSTGTGAGATVGALSYTEAILINEDLLADYANTDLFAVSYGFPANLSCNANTCTIDEAMTWANVTIGRISSLAGVNKGTDYTRSPFIRVYEPYTFPFARQDIILNISSSTASFSEGEEVTQEATSARGLVLASNSGTISVKRLRLLEENEWLPTTNSTTYIVGTSSNAQANIDTIFANISSMYVGLNAQIDNEVQTAAGAITEAEVVDTGFGYLQDEVLTLGDGGEGTANILTTGFGTGFYKRKGGFLSDQQKLHDGLYYQEFSYEVRSSLVFDKYKDMLKQVMHVVGFKVFGALVHKGIANVEVGILPVSLSITDEDTADTQYVFNDANNSGYIPLIV